MAGDSRDYQARSLAHLRRKAVAPWREPMGGNARGTPCAVHRCGRPIVSAWLCRGHGERLARHGSPLKYRGRIRPALDARPGAGEPARADELATWVLTRDRASGCWVWPYSLAGNGYGLVIFAGRLTLAHRAVVMLDGRDPFDAVVMHRCDNPPCVNPAHLVIGTQRENMSAAAARIRRGRLGVQRAREAVRRHQAGDAVGRIAADLGVRWETIYRAVTGETWADCTADLFERG